ncbi:LANO_0B06986g1_1 [Lachancea nothofagi CBS 11611]|uniref:LANO_0B06986g1_1 n=1 Tax=Lachancea nothofagi CBS 11611 TaxID=1266666 RepID=A0A1G4IZI1_9SACH|nr:LANO_0B06986g1_1 [Lachancea nothofagi CBS 11611]
MINSPRVHKSGGAGTTRKIREQLNFSDERRWKQFSGRRLELIEKFKLSDRKASEQDKNVHQIATILRTEFGYPLSASADFEKLVTAAVQSVRRNRKRSSRNKPTESAFTASTSPVNVVGSPHSNDLFYDHNSKVASPSATPQPHDSGVTSSMAKIQPSSLFTQTNQQHDVPRYHSFAQADYPALQPKPQPVVSRPNRTSSLPPIITVQAQNYDELIKAIIADAVHNRVSLHEQSRQDESAPNLTDFALSSNDGNLLNLAFQSQAIHGSSNTTACPKTKPTIENDKIPFFLREKILLHVQRSRACLEVSSAQGSLDLYTNLAILGEASIKASVAFVMERFFSNLSGPSMEYITSKLSSAPELASVAIKIFKPATERHFEQLSQEAQLRLFYLTMGSIIKDFGFDPCVYPLSEIMHDVILRQYPLASNPNGDYKRAAIMSTLSMAPATANKDVYRKVLLKCKDKEQRFTFHLLSNGPPTVAEVLANSRNLFQIVSEAKSLHLIHNGELIKDDMELAKIFNQFTSEEIVVDIREIKPESFDGLAMLSSVSTSTLPSIHEPPDIPSFSERKWTGPSNVTLFPQDHFSDHFTDHASSLHDIPALDSEQSQNTQSYLASDRRSPSELPMRIVREKKEDTQGNGETGRGKPPLVFQPLL